MPCPRNEIGLTTEAKESGEVGIPFRTLQFSVQQACNNGVFSTMSLRGVGDEESRLSAEQSVPPSLQEGRDSSLRAAPPS
jgi:hypothetical protein